MAPVAKFAFSMCSNQTIRLVVDHLVALTDGRFQASSIEDLDVGSGIMDKTGVL